MSTATRASRLFNALTDRSRTILVLGLLMAAAASAGIARLSKDTSMEAFVPQDHPSVQANARTAEVFGLTDSIAVAVMTEDGTEVFSPQVLTLIDTLSAAISTLPNIRTDRVVSLASESSIRGDGGAILVDPYVDEVPPSATAATDAADRWRGMPPHHGTLVARDGSGAVIMAELVDWHHAADTYREVQSLVEAHQQPGVEILVAGPAAVSGYLSDKIDADARVLQPMVVAIVIVFLYLAFLRGRALLGPLLILSGAAGGALGVMSWLGIPYFAITNALPVIIVAISVADAIHILSAYYRLLAQQPDLPPRRAVVLAMTEMARPISLTTLTTIAGFIGLGATSIMPPIAYFSWFAALGVALAWVFSIIVLPCALTLLKLGPSPAFTAWSEDRPDRLGRAFASVGLAAARHPAATLSLFLVALLGALGGIANLQIDRSQVENFARQEPIRQADERINTAFAGTAFLDVIVDADQTDGLLEPAALERIAELQAYFESLPHVQKTVSIVDYLGLLHAAMADTPVAATRTVPDSKDAVAQYLLVYEASGDPTDFAEEISPDYRSALIRGVLNTSLFSDSRPTVEALQRYLETHFAGSGLKATLAGDVNVAYHWMARLERSHFLGVGMSLAMVLAMAIAVFRSVSAGMVAVVPVTFTVLVLYGLMGHLGIFLEPATSMFAAISVGVGVDFAIHIVDRLRLALDRNGGDLLAAVAAATPGTARACFFNAAALGIGFAVLMLSDLPTLQRFGALVSTAAFTSFAAALAITPAAFAMLGHLPRIAPGRIHRAALRLWPIFVISGLLGTPVPAQTAEPGIDAATIARRVAERPEGDASLRVITMTLTDRRGRIREREAQLLRRRDDTGRYSRITYIEPKSVRDVAFLSHERKDGADDRWLYLPATRKVRRIPASDRGDYFLGTDFTYDDIQSNLKFDLGEYRFRYQGVVARDGRVLYRLSGEPASEAISRDLGYGAFSAEVDSESWMPLTIEFSDLNREPLKTVVVGELKRIDGIWTPLSISARNHRTGHTTTFSYRKVAYPAELPARLFQAAALRRGLPDL